MDPVRPYACFPAINHVYRAFSLSHGRQSSRFTDLITSPANLNLYSLFSFCRGDGQFLRLERHWRRATLGAICRPRYETPALCPPGTGISGKHLVGDSVAKSPRNLPIVADHPSRRKTYTARSQMSSRSLWRVCVSIEQGTWR